MAFNCSYSLHVFKLFYRDDYERYGVPSRAHHSASDLNPYPYSYVNSTPVGDRGLIVPLTNNIDLNALQAKID